MKNAYVFLCHKDKEGGEGSFNLDTMVNFAADNNIVNNCSLKGSLVQFRQQCGSRT